VVACDPVLVLQCRAIMTETLAAFLVSLALVAATDRAIWRASVLSGIAFGLAGLCRPSLLPAAGLAALGVLIRGPGGWVERGKHAGTLLFITGATLSPWAIRNARVFGEPVWTTTHGGYTLALANNPVYYRDVLHGAPGAVWSGANQWAWMHRVNRATAGLTEPQADRFLNREGLKMAVEYPQDFAWASIARMGRFWGLAPSGAVYPLWLRVVTAVWTAPLWVLLLSGLLRFDAWRWPKLVAPAFVVTLTAVHAVYWTDMRMRSPIVPAIALLVAQAPLLDWLRSSLRERTCAAPNKHVTEVTSR
jgi:hypothetical protein